MNAKLALPFLLVLLAFPASSLASGPAGPLGGTISCMRDGLTSTEPQAPCDGGDGLAGASAVVATSDGALVYVAGTGASAIGTLVRDATSGTLTTGGTSCIANVASALPCEDGHDLGGVTGLAITPDNAVLYAAAPGDSAVSGWTIALDGSLTGITGACIHAAVPDPETLCLQDPDLVGASDVAVSPDGQNLYVASTTAGLVVTYTIGAGGVLTKLASTDAAGVTHVTAVADAVYATDGSSVLSWARSAGDGSLSTPSAVALPGAAGIAVAPDGDVVVASGDTVTVLTLSGSDLVPVAGGCVHDATAISGCTAGHDLGGATSVRISSDGKTVYVASATASAVAALALAPSGALTQPTSPGSCAHSGAASPTCARSWNLDGASDAWPLPNGDVLATGPVASAVVTLRPQHAPVCVSGSARVERAGVAHLQLTCTDADGDAMTPLPSDPSAGGLSPPNGLSIDYRPDPHFVGRDTFTYTANDGSNDSAMATETITVVDTIAPKLALAFASTKATRGTVKLKVTCKGNDPCKGTVKLMSGKTIVASGSFLPAISGSTRTFTIKLTAAGKTLLARRHRLAVTAVATVKDLGHNVGTSTAKATIRL